MGMEKEVATQVCWGRLCVGAWVRAAIVTNGMEIPSETFGESGLPIFPRTTSESVNSICGQRVRPHREHSQQPLGLNCDWQKAKTISYVCDWLQNEYRTQF